MGVVAGGGDIESAKDHGGQLAEMQTVLEMARQCLKWAASAMGLEDAINNSLDIRSLATKDHCLVHKRALTSAPVILLQGRHGGLVLLLLLLQLLLDGLFLNSGQILGLCLLETSLDGHMEAMIQDTVMSRRRGRRNVVVAIIVTVVIVDIIAVTLG